MVRGKCSGPIAPSFTTTWSAVCEVWLHSVWSGRFVAAAVRLWSPTPLCDTLGCAHILREGFHRGLKAAAWSFGSSEHRRVVIDPRVSLCGLTFLTEFLASRVARFARCYMSISCHFRTLLPFTCSDDSFLLFARGSDPPL